MKEDKISELLELTSSKKFSGLKDFINSPYHNRNKNIIKLYSFLTQKNSGTQKNPGIPKNNIGDFVFGNTKDSQRKTTGLIAEFRALLNSYVMNEYMRLNPTEDLFTLTKIYAALNNEKNYQREKNRYQKSLNEKKKNTWNNYYEKLLLDHTDTFTRLNEIMYSDKEELSAASEGIDMFFICSKLEIYAAMARHKSETSFKLNYNFTFKQEIIENVTRHESFIKKNHPFVYSHYLILMILEDKPGNYFAELKKYLIANMDRFTLGVFKEFMMDYKNSCDSKIHLNQHKYEKEIYFVYDTLDKINAYKQLGGIEPNDFMNAVISALALNKVKQAFYFFEKYKNKIDAPGNEELIEDTVSIVKARLDFHVKDYTGALNSLNKIRSKEFYFYLRIRLLRIKIYYDLNEIDSIGYIIDAVKHYIKRNKDLIGTNYGLVDNFLEYLSRIIRIKSGKPEIEASALLKKLERTHNVASKDWLAEKLNELL